MYIHKALLYVMPAILALAQVYHSDGQISDVRLNNGPSPYVGNIEYLKDGGLTWHATCGENLTLNVVQVICRQLGFKGANRNIQRSTFGYETENAAAYFTCVTGNEENINDCTNITCSSSILGAAACYDDRYLGCFSDNKQDRVLPNSPLISKDMTIEKCIEHCRNNSEYVYAGVENSSECYCGYANATYDQLGRLGDGGCLFHCGGNMYSSCGGNGTIAVFNITFQSATVTTVTFQSATVTTDAVSSSTADESLLTSTTDKEISTREDQGPEKTTLYAGVGGGGGFLVILIIILIIVFVISRRRKAKKKPSDVAQPLETLGAGGDNTSALDTSVAKEDDPCYENKGAEKEREYQNMNELYKREYADLPETAKDKHITYMNSQREGESNQAQPSQSPLYALPDPSSKFSSAKPGMHASSDQTSDTSLMYATPDKRAKTMYTHKGNQNENNFDVMYATSFKVLPERIGTEAGKDAGVLYALPDEKQHDHVTQSGAENTTPLALPSTDDVGLLYAVPNKNGGNTECDEKSVMVENELYTSA